jgi:hypothetical protein
MAIKTLEKTRWLAAMSTLAAATAFAGCTVSSGASADLEDPAGESGASTDAITSIDQTEVKRQSIGNCWLYATVSWIESLHKLATGEDKNVSESYLTYWHWFDQIANSGASLTELSTGGTFGVAAELVNRYGIMFEGDFIAGEATAEMSARQASALSAINYSLKNGVLKDPEARRDRAIVRAELDRAWRLDVGVVDAMNATFGETVSMTLDRTYRNTRTPDVRILRARDFAVKVRDPRTKEDKNLTLADAIGTKSYYSWGNRTGTYAWQTVSYAWDAKGRRNFQKRVQRALHDGYPVIISWFVDFNAMGRDSTFTTAEIARRGGPGSQGGHMTLITDYQINDVPEFGTLKAGETETRADALTAALADEAKIEFFRVKNSWGAYRPDRWDTGAQLGYHDLYTEYLNGPIQRCEGTGEARKCSSQVPLWDVTLPAGY